VSDLSFLDQIPDPVPEDQRPDAERSARKANGTTPEPRQPLPPRFGVKSPDRAELRRRRWVALGLSAAWLVTHLVVYGVRQDLATLPAGYVAVQIGLPFGVAVASLSVALSPGKLGLGVSLGALAALVFLGPLSFWLSAFALPSPGATPGDDGMFAALVCFDITLLWAVLPLLAAAFALRRSFAGGAVWRSALIGAAAGLFSGAAMNLHCTNVDPLHMALGHGLPIVLGALVGAFVLARWLRA
jgi:hypothetical protein